MNRQIVLVGLATLALTVSAAAAEAQGFEYYWSGGRDGGYGSYGSGPLTYANRYSSGRVASRRRISGFYLCSSPYDSGNYRYDCYGRVYPSLNGFGRPGWRPPMY
jgi:hypothetical protein